MPMKANKFEDVPPQAAMQIGQNFTFFYLIAYMVPLFYILSKLAEEKQSKAREGMKMMGLNDGTYFLSYFLFFMSIVLLTSVIIQGTLLSEVCKYSNIFLFLAFNLLYGACIFGYSVLVVAFFPNKRSAA
jgi:ATP-binding cassette subfamily A (ABC1) protein 3